MKPPGASRRSCAVALVEAERVLASFLPETLMTGTSGRRNGGGIEGRDNRTVA